MSRGPGRISDKGSRRRPSVMGYLLFAPCRSALERTDVLRCRTLLAFADFKLDRLTLAQALVSLPGNGGVVHEHVFGSVVGADESAPPLRVEPLPLASCHCLAPLSSRGPGQNRPFCLDPAGVDESSCRAFWL